MSGSETLSRHELAREKRLQDLVDKCVALKGVAVPFSQSREMGALYKSHGAGGVCKALSLYWISLHAEGGSLFNWLGTKGAIDDVAAETVVGLHLDYSNRSRYVNAALPDYQDAKDAWAAHFLARKRIYPRHGITGVNASKQLGDRASRSRLYQSHFMPQVTKYKDVYVQWSVAGGTGAHGAHAMAFYVGNPDVAFFDPNNGEYWLPNAAAAAEWMREFLSITDYGSKYAEFTCRYYSAAHR